MALVVLLTGCGSSAPDRFEGFVFGTPVEVLIAAPVGENGAAAVAEIMAEFNRLHREYHAWQPSQLTRLNQAIAAGEAAEIEEELAAFILDAQKFCRQSGTSFDPGIGRLIALWGFQTDEFEAKLPGEDALSDWLAERPSILDLHVNGRHITSDKPGVAIDFGGYLKGIALDRAVNILRRHGIENALVNIGGNVIVLGSRAPGEPWVVGLRHPRTAGILGFLPLYDGEALGTSGDYQRYFEVGGKRHHHLLDPETGHPATGTQALTVLIPSSTGAHHAGVLSDVLSKPLFIAADGWPAVLDNLRTSLGPVEILRVDANGKIEATAEFKQRFTFREQGGASIELIEHASPAETRAEAR